MDEFSKSQRVNDSGEWYKTTPLACLFESGAAEIL